MFTHFGSHAAVRYCCSVVASWHRSHRRPHNFLRPCFFYRGWGAGVGLQRAFELLRYAMPLDFHIYTSCSLGLPRIRHSAGLVPRCCTFSWTSSQASYCAAEQFCSCCINGSGVKHFQRSVQQKLQTPNFKYLKVDTTGPKNVVLPECVARVPCTGGLRVESVFAGRCV